VAIHQEVTEAWVEFGESRDYMREAWLGQLADGDVEGADEVVPLLLNKQQIAQVVIGLMTIAVHFDKEGRPEGSLDALEVARAVGDQAFLEGPIGLSPDNS
jgi:hypothetical protein